MARFVWTPARVTILGAMRARGATAEDIAARLACAPSAVANRIAETEGRAAVRETRSTRGTPRSAGTALPVAHGYTPPVEEKADYAPHAPHASRSTREERLREIHPAFRDIIGVRFGTPRKGEVTGGE